jgi:hypothetical protein
MNESGLKGFAAEQLKAIRNYLFNLAKTLSSQDQKLLEELADWFLTVTSLSAHRCLSLSRASSKAPPKCCNS